LREGKPLDASEFAVHLDQVREGRAPDDYQKPERFFEETYRPQTEEMRWVDGVLARKKGLGF
jgi:predicted AAA+ superfamily ATPase